MVPIDPPWKMFCGTSNLCCNYRKIPQVVAPMRLLLILVRVGMTRSASEVRARSKSGDLDLAMLVFARARNKDVVLWSSMIGGYSQNGDGDTAMNFSLKCRLRISRQTLTVLALISACTAQLALQQGHNIHGYTIKSGLYSESGNWVGAEELRRIMRGRGESPLAGNFERPRCRNIDYTQGTDCFCRFRDIGE